MAAYPYAESLAKELGSMVDHVPDAVDVVQLAQPDVGSVQKRLEGMLGTVADLAGLEGGRPRVETEKTRTVLRLPEGGLRAVGFHASGAMALKLDLAPFDDIFEADPGDDELVGLCEEAGERLGLRKAVPDEDSLAFERLWRIKAAATDREGKATEPVLCRAVGAFRHSVRELPVYGRASATVELAAGSRLTAISLSARRFAGDGGGETVAKTEVRSPHDAAEEVAGRIVKAFGGRRELSSARLVPEWFRFGYLSLGRRSTQALLAPFYIASIAIEREEEASAHVIAAAGSVEQFVRLPPPRRTSAESRPKLVA
jgi:hypothetical protein